MAITDLFLKAIMTLSLTIKIEEVEHTNSVPSELSSGIDLWLRVLFPAEAATTHCCLICICGSSADTFFTPRKFGPDIRTRQRSLFAGLLAMMHNLRFQAVRCPAALFADIRTL